MKFLIILALFGCSVKSETRAPEVLQSGSSRLRIFEDEKRQVVCYLSSEGVSPALFCVRLSK